MASNGSDLARPLIGLTTYLQPSRHGVWDVESAILPDVYLRGVSGAGGRPVLLPPQPAWVAGELADLDGLILTGGADVDPELYDQVSDPETGTVYPHRDEFEVRLFAAATRIGLPILGICRGVQLINVARGGTLHQHLPDVVGSTEHQPAPAVFNDVSVRFESGSTVAGWYGPRAVVRCHHHQAIDRLGEGLRVTGFAADGTIEAVEDDSGRGFLVGVQWHPEEQPEQPAPFAALVAAARSWRGSRDHPTPDREEIA